MRINDRVAWAIDQVEPGDVVYLVVPNEPANPTITVSDQTFEIAYEDEDFLVINKEAGVATVPAITSPSKTAWSTGSRGITNGKITPIK